MGTSILWPFRWTLWLAGFLRIRTKTRPGPSMRTSHRLRDRHRSRIRVTTFRPRMVADVSVERAQTDTAEDGNDDDDVEVCCCDSVNSGLSLSR